MLNSCAQINITMISVESMVSLWYGLVSHEFKSRDYERKSRNCDIENNEMKLEVDTPSQNVHKESKFMTKKVIMMT